jgi:hypothetical protein
LGAWRIIAPLDREPVGGYGFFVHPFRGIRVAKNERCERHRSVKFVLQHLDCIVVAPREKQPVTDERAGKRVQGVELPGSCHLGDGLVVAPHIAEKGPVVPMGCREQ